MKSTKRSHEFKALKLWLTKDSVSPHTVYLKEHVVREHSPDKPSGKTLLVLNIPPYIDEQCLTNAFSEAGKVKSVKFSLKPGPTEADTARHFLPNKNVYSFKVAYVVFNKVSALDKALKLSELKPVNSEGYQVKTGVKKWIEEYNDEIFQPKSLKERIETFMKSYDQQVKKAEKKEQELEQEDDEGWVTVTKGGKVQSIARTEKVENKILAKEAKANKRKELKNFYTFQIRESKMKNIVALRQKFEEDKRKIQQIKQTRRFKPF